MKQNSLNFKPFDLYIFTDFCTKNDLFFFPSTEQLAEAAPLTEAAFAKHPRGTSRHSRHRPRAVPAEGLRRRKSEGEAPPRGGCFGAMRRQSHPSSIVHCPPSVL